MSMENERVCVKCNKVLHDNEAFCTNCGTISGKIKKGTAIIKANKVMYFGFGFTLLGIGIFALMVVFIIKRVILGSMIGALFGFGLVLITIGTTIIIKWREYINKRKSELINVIGVMYCKHCYTVINEGSKYCYFCGSKIK